MGMILASSQKKSENTKMLKIENVENRKHLFFFKIEKQIQNPKHCQHFFKIEKIKIILFSINILFFKIENAFFLYWMYALQCTLFYT